MSLEPVTTPSTQSTVATSSHSSDADPHGHKHDIVFPNMIPFVIMHLACLGAIWTGVSATTLWVMVALYVLRMFAITAGFHRYFSHRSYKTSRVFHFILGFVGQMSAQQGTLWWAAKHRGHHKYSDTENDPHSPAVHGFWYSHVGWVFDKKRGKADYSYVSDLMRYPELVWLNERKYLPALLLALSTLFFWGWEGLFVGFFMSTVLVYHGTFMINSMAHVVGNQRYITGDDSRNNWLLAIITLGEGWHNNHHYYQTSTRQGFRWWQIDITYYVLKTLSWAGVVWDLRAPPEHVVRGERPLGRELRDRTARELVESFPLDAIVSQVASAWREQARHLTACTDTARQALVELAEKIPAVPTLADLRQRAVKLYAETPSLDEVVARARQLIVEEIQVRLLDRDAGITPA